MEEIINNSINVGIYYIPKEEDEKKIRLEEIKANPQKKHHIDWIKKHK